MYKNNYALFYKYKYFLNNSKGSKPTVLLKQDPSYQEIYTGERVELTCSIKQKTSKWEYKWQKDSVQVNNQDSHTIRNATLDHHGEYTCNITRREMTFVNSTKLNIRGKIEMFYTSKHNTICQK